MSRLLSAVLIALGGGAVVGGGYLAWRRKVETDTEPAAPVALPPVDAPTLTVRSTAAALDPNEVEALARVIASEAGSGTLAEQRAIGWTVRNRFRGKSIYAGEYPWRSQKGSDPPFASARPASDAHRQLAREILQADQGADPTGGATSFFEPRMQDAFAKAGALARAGETGDRVIDGVKLTDITRFKNYKKDAAQIRDKWSNGSTAYAKAGRFEFWGNARTFAQRGGTVREIVVGEDTAPVADRSTESLARAVESSCSRGSLAEKQAVAWACRNRADRLGVPLADVLAPDGTYGPRGTGGRDFVSTAREPGTESIAVARAVLALPANADPTRGAVDFWNPTQQTQFKALGDAYRAAVEAGDESGARSLAVFSDYEEDVGAVREALGACGLRVCAVVGDVELLCA